MRSVRGKILAERETECERRYQRGRGEEARQVLDLISLTNHHNVLLSEIREAEEARQGHGTIVRCPSSGIIVYTLHRGDTRIRVQRGYY